MQHHAGARWGGVGGGFFDVFRLSGDLVGLVVGDVSGRIWGRVHTAGMKYMLRAYTSTPIRFT